MIINETTTKTVNTVVAGYVIEITRANEGYTLELTPLSGNVPMAKQKVYELADKIKLLVEVASKG